MSGSLYVYTGENNDAISVAEHGTGPNGGGIGISIARMALPGKHKTREQINDYAAMFAAAPETAAERDRLLAVNAKQLEALNASAAAIEALLHVEQNPDNERIGDKAGNAVWLARRLTKEAKAAAEAKP